MRSIEFGLGFELKPNGGYILDVREEKHKLIGLIMMTSNGQGYTVCSFVRNTLEFSKEIPSNMRSPRKVQEWVIEHAVAWKERKYTILNPLIKALDKLPRLICTFQNVRFQIIVLQGLIGLPLIVYARLPFKVVGGIITGLAVLNTIIYRKDPFR